MSVDRDTDGVEWIAEGHRAGAANWPDLALNFEAFEPYIQSRKTDLAPEPPWADLFLACACTVPGSGGVEAFDHKFRIEIERIVRAASKTAPDPDDIRQQLYERLFVADGDRRARIQDYSGSGGLLSWLRVSVSRMVLNSVSRRRDHDELDERVLGLASEKPDPELEFLKQKYSQEFRQAFARGVARLTPQERNTLRYAFVQNLSIDQVGAIYAIHRATAARWITRAHENLTNVVRDEFRTQLHVEELELQSVLNLIQSRVSVTLERYLGQTTRAPTGGS